MTENKEVLYTCLKSFWKMAKARGYKFILENEKEWMCTSLSRLLQFSKLSTINLLNALEGLKADDKIDFKLKAYENRDLIYFSNNW